MNAAKPLGSQSVSLLLLPLCLILAPLQAADSLPLVIDDQEVTHEVFGAYVLPGVALSLSLAGAGDRAEVTVSIQAGKLERTATGGWQWSHDQPGGPYVIDLRSVSGGQVTRINAFVLWPFSRVRQQKIGDFRVGKYPDKPLRGLAIYKPPAGFVGVSRENSDSLVSPHFRLGQFVSKQAGAYPWYLVLKQGMLLKLERLLAHIRGKGIACHSLHIMSGYRTPFYNRAIGNVRYSRHQWGDAADIFVDCAPLDGRMDDLNRNGKEDFQDAVTLAQWVEELVPEFEQAGLAGGLAPYPSTSAHGPFVHIDSRGYRARWSGR
jgi:hypothetical protein